MVLQQQPTGTSCGPTVVAMLAGVPARQVIDRLPRIRSEKRARKRTHGTNVAELARLLSAYGYALGRRIRRESAPDAGLFVLRVERGSGRSWHWALLADGVVYDPARFDVGVVGDYDLVSFYELEAQR